MNCCTIALLQKTLQINAQQTEVACSTDTNLKMNPSARPDFIIDYFLPVVKGRLTKEQVLK